MVVQDTVGSKVDTQSPSTALVILIWLSVDLLLAVSSGGSWNRGWTFLPFFSHLVSIFVYRETGSIVCVAPWCSRSARYVEYLRSLSSYLVPSNSHGSSSRLEWRVARIKYSSEAIHFETELRLLRGPGRRRYVREDVREIMHGDREGWLIPFEFSLPRNMVLRNMALMQRKDILGIWFLTFAELLCYIKLRGWNHEKTKKLKLQHYRLSENLSSIGTDLS